MRWNCLIIALLISPLYCFANQSVNTPKSLNNHTIERTLTSENNLNTVEQSPKARTMDYPTQIIRMAKGITNQQLNCAQVNEQIDKVFVNKITKDKFAFTTLISCTYDPETKMAIRFTIHSYFDPLNDEAVAYLDTYLDEYNGIDLIGSPLSIESAKALVVSLNLSVGIKKNPNSPAFTEYRGDRSNFYFKNNYELQSNLIVDIGQRFLTDDPEKILPFLDKWLFNHAGAIYKNILIDSNYALLQPERIFLMESNEPLYVSPIKYYYAHNCNKYEHHKCLRQEL